MKIYTKTGDEGSTSLLGGTLVPKNDSRIEAYGAIDELNSWIGLLSAQNLNQHDKDILLHIQDRLMLLSSHVSDEKNTLQNLSMLEEKDVTMLEQEMDHFNSFLTTLKSFIVPRGDQAVASCHLARSVCRRAERRLVPIIKERKELVIAMKFLNRLSDYLFMLSRKIGQEHDIKEITWKPKF
ncbi:MAG: cob(I)yrinic acid a c-diamide adenosyltransferase [Bacteroides sp. SM23_62_1]|nr:MAG: cob(I)yrinic acid a c-diamide adenosyltransferase [Bacteroides sp. SM23_62_1]